MSGLLSRLLSSCLFRPGGHRSRDRAADRHCCNIRVQQQSTTGPVVDFSKLVATPRERSLAVDDIGKACREKSFFQVINHGISPTITDGAFGAVKKFFGLPEEEKIRFSSEDVTRPVRYATTFQGGSHIYPGQDQRFFLKHYSHPVEEWINMWPSNPPEYREDMARYAVQVRRVALEIMAAIMESLGLGLGLRLGRSYLSNETRDGTHILALNGYPPLRDSGLRLSFPPHTDYTLITVLLQSSGGLEQMDVGTGGWSSVDPLPGSLLVQVGDHLEVLSNGAYRSAIHRVVVGERRGMRVSIASLHGLAMEEKVEVAEELVDDTNLKGYKGTSLKEFLEFLDDGGVEKGVKYLETLKMKMKMRE